MIELSFPFFLDVVGNRLANDALLYSRRRDASYPVRLFCALLPIGDT